MKVWGIDKHVHSVCEWLSPQIEQELFKGKKSDFCFITSGPVSLPSLTM